MFDWFYTLSDKIRFICADETTRDWMRRGKAEQEELEGSQFAPKKETLLKKLKRKREAYRQALLSKDAATFLPGINPLFPDEKTPFQVAKDDKLAAKKIREERKLAIREAKEIKRRGKCIRRAMREIRRAKAERYTDAL